MDVKTLVLKTAHKIAFQTKKHSPELLIGAGIVAATAGVVTACCATLKVEQVLYEHDEKMQKIKDDIIWANTTEGVEPYPQEEVDKDCIIAKVTTGISIVKLYLPAATLFIGGIICILSAHNIMAKRNAALAAAYKLMEEGFNQYRRRVIEDQGVEKDLEYRHGLKREEIEEHSVDEDGNEVITKKASYKSDKVPSIYACFFDESSTQWSKDPAYNLMYLQHQQAKFNDYLMIRGHVFLNEIYDMLGVPRTSAGSVVGWRLSKEGDNCIDFGIYETRNSGFVNGYERSILLDFNVDGVIYDKIDNTYDHYAKIPKKING